MERCLEILEMRRSGLLPGLLWNTLGLPSKTCLKMSISLVVGRRVHSGFEFDRAVQRFEQKESLTVDVGAVAAIPIVCGRRDE